MEQSYEEDLLDHIQSLEEEIIKLKEDNKKVWLLVEKYEEENICLTNANRNNLEKANIANIERQKFAENINKKLKKLESDNGFLRSLVVRTGEINNNSLGQLLKELFDKIKED